MGLATLSGVPHMKENVWSSTTSAKRRDDMQIPIIRFATSFNEVQDSESDIELCNHGVKKLGYVHAISQYKDFDSGSSTSNI
jgi:hypothetical protein